MPKRAAFTIALLLFTLSVLPPETALGKSGVSQAVGLETSYWAAQDTLPAAESPAEIVQAGVLRVGVIPTSPFHSGKDPATGELRGAPADLVRQLADRMGVDLAFVEYEDPAETVQRSKAGEWDLVLGDDDPARQADLDFAVFIENDQTYLVPADSPIQTVADADRPGVRIAVTRAVAADRTLSRILSEATIVRVDTREERIELVRSGQVEAVGSGRGSLLRDLEELPGSRVLDDGFEVTRFAVGVRKDRAELFVYARDFVAEAVSSGFIAESVGRWGLLGYRVPGVVQP